MARRAAGDLVWAKFGTMYVDPESEPLPACLASPSHRRVSSNTPAPSVSLALLLCVPPLTPARRDAPAPDSWWPAVVSTDVVSGQYVNADGSYCLVWGGTHQHSWAKPSQLKDFRAAGDEFAELTKGKAQGRQAAIDEACTGALKKWSEVNTEAPGEAAAAAASGGGAEAEGEKKWHWDEKEEQALRRLIEKDGTGDWDAKAEKLGTGRAGRALGERWRDHVVPRMQENGGKYVPPPRSSSPAAAILQEHVWTDAESRKLLAMVKKSGSGDWANKAEQLGGHRSPRALQQFYYKTYGSGAKAVAEVSHKQTPPQRDSQGDL